MSLFGRLAGFRGAKGTLLVTIDYDNVKLAVYIRMAHSFLLYIFLLD